LAQVLPECRPRVVVNRVRKGPINGEPEQEIRHALLRYASIEGVVFVPYDLASLDKALAGGHSLGEVAPDSSARRALVPLADIYTGSGSNRAGRRRRHRGSARRIA